MSDTTAKTPNKSDAEPVHPDAHGKLPKDAAEVGADAAVQEEIEETDGTEDAKLDHAVGALD
ncbi:MAG: hypothetical protein EON48_17080 [Acetobacteraceae bacterium]|nr:MAG: hypothetical protein EON48_17080 [Acetobacteraceae bacterium]